MMGGWNNGSGAFGNMMNNGYLWSSDNWWMGLIGMGIRVLMFGAFVVLAIYLIRRLTPAATTHSLTNSRAISILDERLANGDITIEEYQKRKKNLLMS